MTAPPRRAGGTRWPRTVILGLLIAHVACSLATFLTMDADLPAVRVPLDAAIDAYELVGCGVYPIGILVVTVALATAWWWSGR